MPTSGPKRTAVQWVRQCEGVLLAAERFVAMAEGAFGAQAPPAELATAWHTLLSHPFHRLLAGSGIPEATEDAPPQLEEVHRTGLAAITRALEAIAPQIDTVGPGEPLALYNSLGAPRQEIIEVELPDHVLAGQADEAPVLLDARREPVPCQLEDGHLVFRADVPPLGYTIVHVCPDLQPPDPATEPSAPPALSASPAALENEFLRLDFAGGRLTQLHDKRRGVDLLAAPVDLVVLRDEGDTRGHGVDAFGHEAGRFQPASEAEVVETGPVRAAIGLRGRWGESEAELTVHLCHGLPRVDLCLWVDWHERHRTLQLAVPTALAEATATFEVPGGAVARPATGAEEPMQRWLDLAGTAAGQAAGLAVANDGVHGADVRDGEMRLSLLRSPSHDPGRAAAPRPDQGEHLFRLRLLPHAGSWQDAGVVGQAESLNVPIYYRWEMVQDGMLVSRASFLSIEPPSVALCALKLAEDGQGLLARLRETAGRQAPARVSFHAGEFHWQATFRPWETKTLRVDLDQAQAHEVDTPERPA